jgi:predicted glycosyltransferase
LEGAVLQPTTTAVPPIDPRLPLLFYCHESLRFGQRARAALLASLSSRFRVAAIAEGTATLSASFPPQVEVVHLPAQGSFCSRAARRQNLIEIYRRVDPAVVVIEQYPFGCREFSDDVASVLDAAAASPRTRLVACSVVETLVDLPFEAPRRDDPVLRVADRYFDVVLVHADARLGRLEDAFEPHSLRVPILYTGLVAIESPGADAGLDPLQLRPVVLVTCDSARPDPALFRAALSACDHWLPRARLPMRIVAGPALPDRELDALQAEAARRADVTVERSAADLPITAGNIAVSVSDGSCDTVFEMLRAAVPALVVVGGWGDDERAEWAHRLAALGVVTLLDRDRLSGAALAAEVTATIMKPPPYVNVNRSGAGETLRLVTRLADPAGSYVHSAVRAEAV